MSAEGSDSGIGVVQFKDEVSRIRQDAMALTRRLEDLTNRAEMTARSNVLLKSYSDDGPRQRRRTPGGQLSEREFVLQNSVLTDLFQSKHMSTIQNALIGVVLFWVMTAAIFDYYERQRWRDVLPKIALLERGFVNSRLAFAAWLKLAAAALSLYAITRFWYNRRASNRPVLGSCFDWLFLLGYILYQCAFLSIPYRILFADPMLGSGAVMALTMEQVRLMMKMHSFVREVVRQVTKSQKKDDDASPTSPDEKPWQFPTFRKYLYFLFAPTLIYRDEYPRTQIVNIGFIVSNFAQFVTCILALYYIVDRYLIPELKVFDPETVSFEKLLKCWLRCAIPGTATVLLSFFGFFHSWLNAWSEMLRFGDRVFYRDWWTCTDYGSYWRQWNCVVHDWLHTYIYKEFHDSVKFGCKLKVVAAFLVFFVSAVFHEYILTAMLGYFFPLMTFYLCGVGFLVTIIDMRSAGRFANVSFWWCNFVFMGFMFGTYVFETAARGLCPPVSENWFIDGISVRFYQCWGQSQ